MPQRSVFISHAHADNALCRPYVEALRARGLIVWYDEANAQAGRSLSREIEQALETHSAFIMMLTPTSVSSFWVGLETDSYRSLMAEDSTRLLLPVRLKPSKIPVLLRGTKWLDGVDRQVDEVVDEIVRVLEGDASVLPFLGSASVSRRRVTRRAFLVAGVVGLAATGTGITVWYREQQLAPAQPEFAPVLTFKKHSAAVNVVAWSRGSDRLASASADGAVQVWNPTDGGNPFFYLSGPEGPCLKAGG
jgi:WD40 repeat protein